VDATNYVMFETGQPLHAFDADKIAGNKIVVKKLAAKTKFKTLDEVERTLSSEDLMICDAEKPMCIAGVFGGIESGVSDTTTNIFIESAYFNSTSVRKSSKFHSLKTDASFRFERGTDPNMTVYAAKRVALLIKEIAEGTISSEVIDIYPAKIKNVKVPFSFARCEQMIGKHIEIETVKTIVTSLGIEIEHEGHDALLLSIPAYKVDVTREQDVIEEVLRIYGYNNIEIPVRLNSSLTFSEMGVNEKVGNVVAQMLTDNGFSEIMGLSLTKEEYSAKVKSFISERNVKMINPLSSDLNVLRQTLLFNGLEAVAYNLNRRNTDLKLYEFGKTYSAIKTETAVKYIESKHLSLLITGRKESESWNAKSDAANIHTLKGIVNAIFERIGISNIKMSEYDGDLFSLGMSYSSDKKKLVELGIVSKPILKMMDIKQDVLFADFNWDAIAEVSKKANVMYAEVPKFPEVRRDLALLIDKAIKFEQLEQLAFQSEKKLLKAVNLFDIYEGDKLPAGKKSYALSFILQDENATLTDKQIDKTMETLMKNYQEKVGAEIR
jgi:phenylalanyl-tRNA synthetase beta chain